MSSVGRLSGVTDHHPDDNLRGHVNHHGWCRRGVPLAVMACVEVLGRVGRVRFHVFGHVLFGCWGIRRGVPKASANHLQPKFFSSARDVFHLRGFQIFPSANHLHKRRASCGNVPGWGVTRQWPSHIKNTVILSCAPQKFGGRHPAQVGAL